MTLQGKYELKPKEIKSLNLASMKETLLPILVLSLLFSIILTLRLWGEVSHIELVDNDDYMRYHQFTQWLNNHEWYLKPIDTFNPQDDTLIHWSRLPDIPLATISYLVAMITSSSIANTVAMTVVPLFYMVIVALSMGVLSIRMFSAKHAFIIVVFTLASPLTSKLFPGSIDHHNIQLALAALFLASLPLSRSDCQNRRAAYFQGLMIALSLWVGVGNIVFYIICLFMLTVAGYIYTSKLLHYCAQLCFSSFIFCVIFSILNRPLSEFFITRLDALSLPFILCFLSGFLFCRLSTSIQPRFIKKEASALHYLLFAFISFGPLLFLYPSILLGGYAHYPPLLTEYWLSHVTEAKPLIEYLLSDGLFSNNNYLLILAPALLSWPILPKSPPVRLYYCMFILCLIVPFVWQARTIFIASLVAAPLQAYFALYVAEKMKFSAFKAMMILLCTPFAIFSLLEEASAPPHAHSDSIVSRKSDIKMLLDSHNIYAQKILAPIEYGAPILALTNNHIVAAPYHRNIQGNTLAIQLFTSIDLPFVQQSIIKHQFDYIVIGRSHHSDLLLTRSDKNSFINQLTRSALPDWLALIESHKNGTMIFEVKREGDINDSTF